MSIDLPQLLSDGSVLMVEHDFIKRLHEGDSSLGWLGDERLGVYATPTGLEIRRLCEDGELRVIMRSKPGVRVLDTDTLRFLAAHDGRGAGADIVDRILAQNARVDAENDAKFREFCDEAADRLEFALMKDIGTHEGSGARHRLYTGIDIPKGSK